MQQNLAKLRRESCPVDGADKDDDTETATNVSDNSSSLATEKCGGGGADTTPSVNESLDKRMNYESSQENLNQHVSEGRCNAILAIV
jgi:hypothetical protein